MTSSYWAPCAWVDSKTVADVLVDVEAGLIQRVQTNVPPPAGATQLTGWVVPGMVNTHSHVFHRALRGRVQATGDFWTWRQKMYALAERLNPDSLEQLAVATYTEMLAAGITLVGEFHYLHHGPNGQPYQDPNEMSMALVRAAEATGIRLCLLDTCYLSGGIDGREPEGAQRRFSDGDVERWRSRHHQIGRRLADHPLVNVGAAIHSVRAVPPAAIDLVAADAAGAPLHVHVSEQPDENEACLAATGLTPVGLLADRGALGPATVAVHAVHVSDTDRAVLAGRGSGVCACPTTEFDLGDGRLHSDRLAEEGVSISLGSDSHAVIDLFMEARAVEWNDRARTGRRGIHTGPALWGMATQAGAAALGQRRWGLVEGAPADFIVISPVSARTAGVESIEALLFAAAPSDVVMTVVGGEVLVAEDEHARVGAVGRRLSEAIERTWTK